MFLTLSAHFTRNFKLFLCLYYYFTTLTQHFHNYFVISLICLPSFTMLLPLFHVPFGISPLFHHTLGSSFFWHSFTICSIIVHHLFSNVSAYHYSLTHFLSRHTTTNIYKIAFISSNNSTYLFIIEDRHLLFLAQH